MLTPNEELDPSHRGRKALESYYEEFEAIKEDTDYFEVQKLKEIGLEKLREKIQKVSSYVDELEPNNHREEFLKGKISILIETLKGKLKEV